MFTSISESRAESHRFKHAQVLNFFRKVPKFSRPFNYGIGEGMSILVLVGWVGAAPMGADREGLYWKESFDVEAGTVVVDPLHYQEEDNGE